MPRTTTNAITLDEQEVSQAKPVGAKKHSSHISSAKIVRIERRYLEGQSAREIARAENCGRNTVSRIVKAPELQAHLQRIRERIWGMADDAADVVLEAIVQKRDVRISYELLRDIGVLPRASQVVQQPTQLALTREERDDWQTRAIASVIAERHRVFGIELPPEKCRKPSTKATLLRPKCPSLIRTQSVSSKICAEGPIQPANRWARYAFAG